MNQKFVKFIGDNVNKYNTILNQLKVFFDIDITLFKEGIIEKKKDSLVNKTVYLVFINHPNSLGITYGEHMSISLYFAFNSLMAFFIFLVHSFFPIIFNHKGTELLEYIIEISKELNNLNKK